MKPRKDGKCVDCGDLHAVTYDGLFCRTCLRARIKADNPIATLFNDARGRTARSTRTLGGSSDMRTTDQQE
jgi:hypothetical protein